jgi:hypothetical protein
MQPNLKAPRARRARRRGRAPHAERGRDSGSTKRAPDVEPVFILARETHTSWFERARPTSPERPRDSSGPPSAERYFEFSDPKIVVQAAGEQPPAVAGALAGALGGVIGLAVFAILAPKESAAFEPFDRLGGVLSLGVLGAPLAGVLGVVGVFAACIAVGLAFGVVARRLRRALPLLALAVVSVFGAALSLRCVLLERIAPAIAQTLPIGPTLLAACAFGAALALELPIRQLGAASTR